MSRIFERMENFQNDCSRSWTKKPFKNSYLNAFSPAVFIFLLPKPRRDPASRISACGLSFFYRHEAKLLVNKMYVLYVSFKRKRKLMLKKVVLRISTLC